jgi:hypothetical protein
LVVVASVVLAIAPVVTGTISRMDSAVRRIQREWLDKEAPLG